MQFVTLPHGLTWSDIKILNFINMSIRSYIINKKTKHCATGAKEGDAWTALQIVFQKLYGSIQKSSSVKCKTKILVKQDIISNLSAHSLNTSESILW